MVLHIQLHVFLGHVPRHVCQVVENMGHNYCDSKCDLTYTSGTKMYVPYHQCHEKRFLPMQKQRHRSTVKYLVQYPTSVIVIVSTNGTLIC